MKKSLKILIVLIIIIIIVCSILLFKDDFIKEKSIQKEVENKTKVKSGLTVEIGNEISNKDYFEVLDNEKVENVKILKDDKEVINLEIDNYDVEITTNKNIYKTKLNVIDTVKPELKLKEVEINENEQYDILSFIDNCTDNSNKECQLEYKNEDMSSYNKEGIYDIIIIASDLSGNSIENTTKLVINKSKKESKKVNEIKKEEPKNKSVIKVEENKENVKANVNESVKKEELEKKEIKETISQNENVRKMYSVTLIMKDYKMGFKLLENDKIPQSIYASKIDDTFKEWQLDGKKFDINTPVTRDMVLTAVYNDVATISYKYGVKVTTLNSKNKYEHSTFNATTSDLKPEAISVANSNKSVYNEILKYVNELRVKEGASPLVLDNTLTIAATTRAIEMAWGNNFSHTRPNGKTCFTVIDDYNIAAMLAGENIALNQRNAKEVFNSWNNSSEHHANMVNKNFTKIGIGKYKLDDKTYWVQLFIK